MYASALCGLGSSFHNSKFVNWETSLELYGSERARLQAEAKAAEDARKQAEAEAAAEARRKRELEREAARLALQQVS